jgi:hypothetical protein
MLGDIKLGKKQLIHEKLSIKHFSMLKLDEEKLVKNKFK